MDLYGLKYFDGQVFVLLLKILLAVFCIVESQRQFPYEKFCPKTQTPNYTQMAHPVLNYS